MGGRAPTPYSVHGWRGFPLDPHAGHRAGVSVPSRDRWTQGLKRSPFHSHPNLTLTLTLTLTPLTLSITITFARTLEHTRTLTLTLILTPTPTLTATCTIVRARPLWPAHTTLTRSRWPRALRVMERCTGLGRGVARMVLGRS